MFRASKIVNRPFWKEKTKLFNIFFQWVDTYHFDTDPDICKDCSNSGSVRYLHIKKSVILLMGPFWRPSKILKRPFDIFLNFFKQMYGTRYLQNCYLQGLFPYDPCTLLTIKNRWFCSRVHFGLWRQLKIPKMAFWHFSIKRWSWSYVA